jgi:succinate dehydrogenase hydrophobic anchor subunit
MHLVHILKRKQRMEQDPFVAEESFKCVSNRVKPWTAVILTVFLVVVAVHIAAGMTPLT